MPIVSRNPATGEILRSFESLTPDQLDSKLAASASAFRAWRHSSFPERRAVLLRAAEILERDALELGRLATLEMGKLLGSGGMSAAKCATACRYYAEHAESMLAEEVVATKAKHSAVRFQPIGPVLAIMPWNFPYWQVFRFAAPAIMAGNTGMLKHASSVPQCALAIEDIFRRADLPEGVFQTLLIGPDLVEKVIDDPRVAAVTLTGSEPAGAKVASRAALKIKKAVLELGGSDAFIVMPSADYDAAVQTAVRSRCINNGQSCIAAKRFIVHQDIYDRFENDFCVEMAALQVGDPMDPNTGIGPLATKSIRDDLEEQVSRAVREGARLVTGGRRADLPGYFYCPTVLADLPRSASVFQEELFGPVAMLFRASGIEEALEIANDCPFGLGSALWTNDDRERDLFLEEIQAGLAFVNGMVASDTRLPFGGVKRSGFGRELARYGLLEFVNIKTINID